VAVGQLYTEGHGVLHLMNAKGFLLIVALDAVFLAVSYGANRPLW
jgi:hypothetical protein